MALLAGLCAALTAACVLLFATRSRGAGLDDVNALFANDEVREALLAKLIQGTPAGLDSHPDAEVAYLNLPGEATSSTLGHAVDVNPMGMRERPYALPKPPGTLRVVVLGDSYVFGWGVAAEERLGVHLEAALREGASDLSGEVECLHLAVASWNVVAECAWLLRQLEALRPDLVLHVTAENDLSETAGVRGFGGMSTFVPARRAEADSRIHSGAPRKLGVQGTNFLAFGLDHESRTRLDEAAGWIRRVQDAVREQGGEYVLIANWDYLGGVLARHWEGLVPEERFLFLPSTFVAAPELRISRDDRHWSAEGHARLARMLYGYAAARGLVPGAALAVDSGQAREAEAFFAEGRADAEGMAGDDRGGDLGRLLTAVDLDAIDPAEALQVHGGIDVEGRVSPYASVLLRRGDATRIEVEAEDVSLLALRGARVEVFVEEHSVGTLELGRGAPLALDAALPEDVQDRDFLSVRFRSSDYIYAGDDLRRCISFRLRRVALVP